MMRPALAATLALLLAMSAPAIAGEGGSPGRFRHRIAGLFAESRERALRDALARIPGVRLVSLDLEEAEAVLEYDPARLFPGAGPEQFPEQLDHLLRAASDHTLGVRPPSTIPRDRLRRVEIAVAGLDCEACSLALYEILSRVDGVDRVKASFRDGRAVAWIDPARTDRSKLVEALRMREVDVRSP